MMGPTHLPPRELPPPRPRAGTPPPSLTRLPCGLDQAPTPDTTWATAPAGTPLPSRIRRSHAPDQAPTRERMTATVPAGTPLLRDKSDPLSTTMTSSGA